MRVLMLSGDKKVLTPGTEAFARLALQRSAALHLDVFVWPQVHSVWSLWRAALSGRYDVITVQDPFWRGLVALGIARLVGVPLQVQVHTDFTHEVGHTSLRRLLGVIVLRYAAGVRVVTERIQKEVLAHTHAPVSVLPVYIDLEHVRSAQPAPLQQEYGFQHIVLVVARLEVEKNVAQAITCMRAVVEKVPTAGLVIVGEGSQRPALEWLVAELGLQNHVRFVGYQKHTGSFYKSADLLLVPSLFESYGAAIVEALSVGIPVVSMDVGIARLAAKDPIIVAPGAWMTEGVQKIVETLQGGVKVELVLKVLSKEEWVAAWKQGLFDTIHR